MRKSFIIFAISLFLFISNVSALTKAPVDVTKMSIEELLNAMDKGYITSEILVNIYLERIEAYDEKFNSINQLNEHAIEQARELDEEREKGKLRGKLHGIPILVKCNIDVYGMPTTGGTKALLDNYPKDNAYVVEKLVKEGAVVLGSTNMSELAFSASNSYSSYGYVRNVFNRDYTSYGSSGGSAVAVKAAFAAVSLGTDTNSSVRLPASGAGLVGMRPTLGLVSRTGVIPYDIERDTVGVLSRDVSDNALIMSIIAGYDEDDKITKDAKVPSEDISKAKLKGVTIGVATQYVKGSESGSGVTGLTDSDIYKLLEKSIKELEDNGAKIVYLDKFVKSSNITIATSTYAGRTMCDEFNKYIKGTTGSIRSFQELNRASGHVQNLTGYASLCGEYGKDKNWRDSKKATYRKYVQGYFDDYDLDVILYPTLKNKVFSYKKGKNVSPGSSLGSVIGYPSITVPMGFVNEFSYGIEFLGEKYRENTLYNVAAMYEKINGNKVDTSPLTPSLYEVPENVTKLITLYEKAIKSNSKIGKVSEWITSVDRYFDNYNSNNDVDEDALLLINEYNNIFASFFSKETFNECANILGYIAILMMVAGCLIIFYEIKMCFR